MNQTLVRNERCFIYVDDQPLGTGWVREDGSIEFPRGYEPKDGHRIVFLQADEWDHDEFDRQFDDDAWVCDTCGGEGHREYMDAPDEWGEDCPSEPNHLIPCRYCDEVERDKLRAFAVFLWKKHTERSGAAR